ncbi:MAG: hypothetical protein N2234_01905 [Planctomycetota bacterium]|nr:hypothetical protein [Planctomycetota bacterium]
MGWRANTETLTFFADPHLDATFQLREEVISSATSVVIEVSVEGEPLKTPQVVTVCLNEEEKKTLLVDKSVLPFSAASLKTNNSIHISKIFDSRLRVTLLIIWKPVSDETLPAVKK